MRDHAYVLAALVGAVLVVVGLGLAWLPLAPIVGGAAVVLVAWRLELAANPPRPAARNPAEESAAL